MPDNALYANFVRAGSCVGQYHKRDFDIEPQQELEKESDKKKKKKDKKDKKDKKEKSEKKDTDVDAIEESKEAAHFQDSLVTVSEEHFTSTRKHKKRKHQPHSGEKDESNPKDCVGKTEIFHSEFENDHNPKLIDSDIIDKKRKKKLAEDSSMDRPEASVPRKKKKKSKTISVSGDGLVFELPVPVDAETANDSTTATFEKQKNKSAKKKARKDSEAPASIIEDTETASEMVEIVDKPRMKKLKKKDKLQKVEH